MDVDLEQRRRVIRGATGGFRLGSVEAQILQIQLIDK
jgi:hypothetical protein